MIDWPEKLIESIARRRSVLFLGSGISANSQNATGKRPATWDVFLRRVIANQRIKIGSYEAEILKLLDEKKYLIACE